MLANEVNESMSQEPLSVDVAREQALVVANMRREANGYQRISLSKHISIGLPSICI